MHVVCANNFVMLYHLRINTIHTTRLVCQAVYICFKYSKFVRLAARSHTIPLKHLYCSKKMSNEKCTIGLRACQIVVVTLRTIIDFGFHSSIFFSICYTNRYLEKNTYILSQKLLFSN